jgi:5-methylcytosine-specific restriction endonuclease McrA
LKVRKPKPKLHALISSALRKIFMWSDVRYSALKASKNKCAHCKKRFYYKELQVDHIIPVGSTPGSKYAAPEITWDDYIKRMFCDISGLQILCKKCHHLKTYKRV